MTKIDILAMGKGWIVIDKPSGISVHNDPGRDLVSCVTQIIRDDSILRQALFYHESDTISPAHRLDRETSGVIILGFKKEVLSWFSRQFEERFVGKSYLALVHGNFDISCDVNFIWDIPLSQEAGGRKKIEGTGKKVVCRTKVKVIEKSPRYSLIACEPLTGRTHQIRRHAAIKGHPVLGDERYGSKRAVSFLKNHGMFDRLGLHSHMLTIKMPEGNGERTFISPCPLSFKVILQNDYIRDSTSLMIIEGE